MKVQHFKKKHMVFRNFVASAVLRFHTLLRLGHSAKRKCRRFPAAKNGGSVW
jgi:hypothetical protein